MSEKKVFTSKLVRTSNIVKELLLIAKEYGLSVHDLDFKLIKVEIYVKSVSAEKDSKKKSDNEEDNELHEATAEELAQLQGESGNADLTLVIKQVYDAEIFLLEENLFPDLNMVIAGNKTLTAVYATIKAGSIIKANRETAATLKAYFNHRKLRTHILIDIWDAEMVGEVAKMAAQVEVNESVEFKEDKRILISKSLHSIPTVHDKLILHFDDKQKSEDDYGRIDYKKRGFITAVERDEVLISYRKPIAGTPGRNCKGGFIEVPEADASHAPAFDVDEESIRIQEDDNKIEYLATKNGYIDMDGSKYFIKEDLEVSEISFKSTGNVNAGLNTDISIHVKETDSLTDAIGMGVEVEATEIDVEGNTGSNSIVKAKKIKIGGQTHKSSTIIAPDIEINLHRGLAKGEKVQIKRLEQGRVEGDEVHIEQAAGGEVVAKNVTIEILQSHVNIVASESITIKKMRGSENVLIIDQSQVGENLQASGELEVKIDEKRMELNVSKKELDKEKAEFKKHESTITEIKERLIAYKKAGAKLPDAFVQKYKELDRKSVV